MSKDFMSKDQITLRWFFALIVFSQICTSCGPAGDPDKIFLEELDRFANSARNDSETAQDQLRILQDLGNFSKKFPDSQFADDARFIYVIMFLAGQWDPALRDDFLSKYPEGSLEVKTRTKLERIFGVDVYLPYKPYFALAEASENARQQNFKKAKDNLVFVLPYLDNGDPKLKKLKSDISRRISSYDSRLRGGTF